MRCWSSDFVHTTHGSTVQLAAAGPPYKARVVEVVDIEESVLSAQCGLRGTIDAVLEVPKIPS